MALRWCATTSTSNLYPMMSGGADKERRQRYAALMDAAERHEGAAARHDAAARTFNRLGKVQLAEHERTLAYEQRRKALGARLRANAELSDS
jgi:hypothetical protein